MKNNYIRSFLILIACLFFSLSLLADDFDFESTEVQVSNNGNIYKGSDGGSVTSDKGLKITSDSFDYNKLTNILEAHGNVIIFDPLKNITLYAEDVFYYKNEEKIFTVGATKVNIEDKYNVDSSDMFLFRNDMILSSKKKTSMRDDTLNFYVFDNFIYLINKKVVKGDNMKIYNHITEFTKDVYNFENGFFNLTTKKFLAKDVNIKFNNELYGNKKNEPRLKGTSGDGDEFNTYIENGVFTSCKQEGDKCPPWVVVAEKVRHDKIKKSIIYKNAWLKIYDVPVAYFPKFFHPDPSVNRQSGFLDPSLISSQALGTSFHVPYFYVISDSADLTFKPRIYDSNKLLIHSELRKKTKNSYSLLDFSWLNNHRSSASTDRVSRSHFLFKSDLELELKNEEYGSGLAFQYQKTSQDTYLKVFNLFELEDEMKPKSTSGMESFLKFNLDHADFKFDASFLMNETLGGRNSDRYSYSFPNYYFTKELKYFENYGALNFSTNGTNSLSATNKVLTSLGNNLDLTTYNYYSNIGLQNSINFNISNSNTLGKKDTKNSLGHFYEPSPQSDVKSVIMFNSSLPLKKLSNDYFSTLNPQASIMFGPHEMNNDRNKGRSLKVDSIFNTGRSGASSPEEGVSLALGLKYKIKKLKLQQKDLSKKRYEDDEKRKEKIESYLTLGMDIKVEELELEQKNENIRREDEDKKRAEADVDKYFEFKIGGVLRPKVQKNIPKTSTLDQTSSNLLGKASYNLSKNLKIDYNFSVDNDLNTFENNTVDATIKLNKLVTTFNFIETNGKLGDSNSVASTSKYNFDDYSSLSFSTRRNRKISLTEYYKLVYEYKNDCLVAALRYDKKFYSDNDLKPYEEVFFTITVVPLTAFDQKNILKLGRNVQKNYDELRGKK